MLKSEPKFTLAPLTLDDAGFLLDLLQSPEYIEFIGDRGVDTLDKAAEYLDGYFLASEREHGFGYLVVRNENDKAIGMVGMMKREYMDYPDLGFAFLPESFGKGYALASCKAYLEQQQAKSEITQIEAFTDVANKASQRLLERLGFELIKQFPHPDDGVTMMVYKLSLA